MKRKINEKQESVSAAAAKTTIRIVQQDFRLACNPCNEKSRIIKETQIWSDYYFKAVNLISKITAEFLAFINRNIDTV